MNINLELLSLENADDIYDFEVKNRAYFEKNLPSRGDDYYILDKFKSIINLLINEQSCGDCFMYIIRNEVGEIVGRVNFTDVKTNGVKSAELGYRIGQNSIGKGVATKAVQIALKQTAQQHNLEKITAGTSPNNKASQRVLEKNGFIFAGMRKIEIGEELIDSLEYVINTKRGGQP